MTFVTLGRSGARVGLALALTFGGLSAMAWPSTTASAGTHPSSGHAFVAGSGGSDAGVFAINVPYAGANFGFGAGITSAGFFDSAANSSAQTFDPSFINLVKALKLCNSTFPLPLPPPTTADTNETHHFEVTHRHSDVGTDGGTLGSESAIANRDPEGTAKVAISSLTLGSLVSAKGGTATSRVQVVAHHQERIATAISMIGDLSAVGGLIDLKGLRWSLVQRTVGADSRTSRTTYQPHFTIGEMRVGALTFHSPTAQQIGTGVAAMDRLTSPLGFRIVLPTVSHTVGGEQYLPLQFSFGGKVSYGKALATLLTGSHGSVLSLLNSTGTTIFDPSQCKELGGVLNAAPDANYTVNFVGVAVPIVLQAMASAFSGGADVDLNFGGVATSINNTYYKPPSAPPLPPTSPQKQPSSRAPATVPFATPVNPTSIKRERAPVAVGPTLASPTAFFSYICRSDSPAGGGCLHNRSFLAGLIAATLGGGMFIVDETWRRRRRKRSPGAP